MLDNGTRHPNLACMKISAYYKSLGWKVTLLENYDNLEKYDLVTISRVFSFTHVPNIIYKRGVCKDPRLIKYAHTGASGKNTGLTSFFNFSQHFTKLPYYNNQTHKIDCKALKRFIDSYYSYCSDKDLEYLNKKSFVVTIY